MNDRDRALHLNPAQVVAGALASVTAAVLASFFGVAGTIIGAGVMSAAASIGNAVYSYWIRSTHRAIRETIPSAFRQQVSTVRTLVGAGVRSGGSAGSSGDAGIDGAEPAPDTNEVPALDRSWDVPPPGFLGAPPTAPGPPPGPGGHQGRDVRAWIEGLWPAVVSVARSLRWRNIALATLVVFGLSMGAVTAVEALAKKPLSGIVGGSSPAGATTSLGGLVGGGQSSRNTPTPPSPSESTTTNPQTTTPNGSSTTTTSPSSTGSTTPGSSTTTTTPSSSTNPSTPGSNGTSPGASGSSSGATSSGSSSGSSSSGSSASSTGSSASGGSSTGTQSAGG